MARSPKKAKITGRTSRAKKDKSAGAGGNGRELRASDNGGNSEAIKAGFHQHRNLWNQIQAKKKAILNQEKEMVAAAKADGYQKQEFIIADMLAANPKKEAKVVAAVETRIRVARWMGHGMGNQYDLFADAPKQSPMDAAFADGKQSGVEGKSAEVPGQFSSADLSNAWMEGWHAGQAHVHKGFKPIDDDKPAAGWGETKQA